jgi:hypothetical protein
MRGLLLVLTFTACTLFGAGNQGAAQPPPSQPPSVTKKLIEFGWDKPRPAQLTTAQLEGSVFDGVMFQSSAGERVIVPEVLPVQAFDDDIAALKRITSGKLRNSLYILNVNASTWDWFDDTSWAAAEQNLFQLARVAREGGLRGLMIDPEVYEFDLWAYASQPQKAKYSFAQFEAQMRKRGAQTMRAFERAYPGITLLHLYFFSAFEAPQNATYETAHASLEMDGSLGLHAAFLEGMLEAATDKAVFIDGYEPSYYHLNPQAFDAGRKTALETAQVFVRPDLREKFKRQVRFGNAVYVDGVMNLHDSARFFGYYLENDADRRNLIAHNVYHGLRSADEFVWVYSENTNWWTRDAKGKTDLAALEAAMKRGRDQSNAGQPLEPDPSQAVTRARVAFDAKISVGGDILGKAGLNVRFGVLQNHCGTWNNAQRWSCVQAGGSSFTVTPTADGVSFTPASRSFTNINKDDWSVNFTAK